MCKTKIFHNPRCSKSRRTLELLKENGLEPVVIEYLKDPPTETELQEIVGILNVELHDLIREKEFAELGFDLESLQPEQLIKQMVLHPRVIQRPIVVHNGRACIGRPPENVLKII